MLISACTSVTVSLTCTRSRNFPKAGPSRGYWLEATCDDIAQTTVAIFGSSAPQWGENDRLEWTLPKARLQAVRAASQLGKLRIDCCAGERHHNKIRKASRMVIGSVFLDALSARPKSETRWFPLLNCLLPTSPDLCIQLEIASAKPPPVVAADPAAGAAPEPEEPEEMVFLIGDGEKDFVLTIAAKLVAPASPSGGELSIQWLGHESALQADATERHVVQLQMRSSIAELRAFFANAVPVQLMTSRTASVDVSLEQFAKTLTDDGRAMLSTEAVVEDRDSHTRLQLEISLAPGATADSQPTGGGGEGKAAAAEVLALTLTLKSVEPLVGPPVAGASAVVSVFCPGQSRLRFSAPFTLEAERKPITLGQEMIFELPGLQVSRCLTIPPAGTHRGVVCSISEGRLVDGLTCLFGCSPRM